QSGRPLAAPALSGDQAGVADYLLDVVLDRQPAPVREFLLRTSVLERLSAPLCNAVAERDDSAAMLDELDRQNLFTFRLDEQRIWYRYHHLFAEFLQSRLRQLEPGRAEALCLRASRWYEAQGAYAEALEYALRAGAMEQAAGLLEPYGRDLFRAGSFKELKHSLEQLPEAVLREHAELCVLHGWASAYAGEFELARQRAADAEAAADRAASPAVVRAETQVLLCTLGVIRTDEPMLEVLQKGVDTLLKEADSSVRAFAEVALGYANRALGRLPEAATHLDKGVRLAELGGSSLVNMLARYNLSALALLRGERRYAESMGRGSLDFAERRHWLGTMGAAFVRVQLGVALYEANRLEESLAELDTAIEVLRSTQAFGFLGVAVVIRAGVYWALGQQDRVQLDLEWAERIAGNYQVARVRIRKLQLQSRMALAATRPGYARRYLEQGLALVGEVDETRLPWPERYEQFGVIDVRLQLAEQDWDGALVRAQAVLASAEAAGRHYNRIEVLALAAETQLALGAEPAAEAALREALAIAVPEQLWRPFYHIGPRLPQLLARLAGGGDQLARDLLAAMGQAADSPALDEPLHLREQQILELMAGGLRNREIGARLFLSEETVKWYLKRLYRTLDVHSRTAAVAKARELGLIANGAVK
ncbi:MAG TPA: LuxR C-terminal-related transcriptional regulator, partial [Gammaproteobacteria bacterium]|nr:LuxR C-terminal-related transcriptional regulator [Gammaproteobacteria bacterium]